MRKVAILLPVNLSYGIGNAGAVWGKPDIANLFYREYVLRRDRSLRLRRDGEKTDDQKSNPGRFFHEFLSRERICEQYKPTLGPAQSREIRSALSGLRAARRHDGRCLSD
jgi:hypothetical protein